MIRHSKFSIQNSKMSKLKPLQESEMPVLSEAVEKVREGLGFLPNSVKTMARVPKIMEGFANLIGSIMGPGEVDLYLKDLVSHVASNASGCRYCQAHTIGSAIKSGVSEAQLNNVWDFENSEHFNEKEKAALRFGFAAGSVPNGVTSQHFEDLKKHFSETQIVELGGVVSIFGFLNRWNDSFGTPLEAAAADTAKALLGASGWEIGQHG